MKKFILFLTVLGVIVCLKPNRYWQPGIDYYLEDIGKDSVRQCVKFEKEFGSGAASYLYCFGDYSDQKVCVPQDNIMDIRRVN
jgi:hypothetical protein